jgi:hypothetical protein
MSYEDIESFDAEGVVVEESLDDELPVNIKKNRGSSTLEKTSSSEIRRKIEDHLERKRYSADQDYFD